MNAQLSPKLVLSDSHGVFIPQIYCETADEEWAQSVGVDYRDVLVCQAGPDHEWYWESRENILNNAHIVVDGVTWTLIHSQDLYEVPSTYKWPEI